MPDTTSSGAELASRLLIPVAIWFPSSVAVMNSERSTAGSEVPVESVRVSICVPVSNVADDSTPSAIPIPPPEGVNVSVCSRLFASW